MLFPTALAGAMGLGASQRLSIQQPRHHRFGFRV